MNKKKRIISKIEIKGLNLVKGVNLEGLRVLGKPEYFAEYYYKNNIDEIIYQDVVASLYGRNNLKELIEIVSEKIFIPMIVGGGLKSLNDIREILRAGADRVCINSEGIKNPDFLKNSVKEFGSSTIVVNIQIQKTLNNEYLCFIENGRQVTDYKLEDWACKVQDLGVGELLITSINNDGTGKGFDLSLINKLENKIEIPIILSGGAGSYEHVKEAFNNTKIDGIAISSMFHYFLVEKDIKNIQGQKYQEGNLAFLKKNVQGFNGYASSIINLKNFLMENNIPCKL